LGYEKRATPTYTTKLFKFSFIDLKREKTAMITLKKDEKINQKIDVPCGICKRSTKHLILTDILLNGYEEPDGFYGWNNEYQIIQCQGCETVSFRKTHENSDDMVMTGPNDWEPAKQVNLYPNHEECRLPLADIHLLPNNLERIYIETLNALNSELKVLAGIGIRAIIETVCKDKSATGTDLFLKVNNLVSQGVLTQDGAEILHKLRSLGNAAAHEVKPHSYVELGLAFDVVDHLLQGVYILPHHAKKNL
jgi:hypothetical protein